MFKSGPLFYRNFFEILVADECEFTKMFKKKPLSLPLENINSRMPVTGHYLPFVTEYVSIRISNFLAKIGKICRKNIRTT